MKKSRSRVLAQVIYSLHNKKRMYACMHACRQAYNKCTNISEIHIGPYRHLICPCRYCRCFDILQRLSELMLLYSRSNQWWISILREIRESDESINSMLILKAHVIKTLTFASLGNLSFTNSAIVWFLHFYERLLHERGREHMI